MLNIGFGFFGLYLTCGQSSLVRLALSAAFNSDLRVIIFEMNLRVLVQVIRTGKPLFAVRTDEMFLSRVSLDMSGQFIGSGETLTTHHKPASERTIPDVPAKVSLQV